MRNNYFLYWGKASSSVESVHTQAYHPLPYHGLDVAAVARVILEKDTLLREKLTVIAKIQDLVPLVCFFLALHDLGKFSIRFQNLVPGLLRRLQDKESSLPYSKDLHHTRLGFLLWQETLAPAFHDGRIFDLQPSYKMRDLRTCLNPWFLAVTGHHGRPPIQKPEHALTLFEPDDVQCAIDFVQDVAALFVHKDNIEKLLNKELKDTLKKFSYALAGLTTLCDWIGSDERFFSPEGDLNASLEAYFYQTAVPRAEQAVIASGILGATPKTEAFFHDLFPGIEAPSPLQIFAQEVWADDQPLLLIFEDMTGSGKTEAAFTAVSRLMAAGASQSLYWALPTMATANAMYERMAECYRRLFTVDAQPSLVLSHSARQLMDAFQDSIGLENIPVEESNPFEISGQAQCSAWLADNKKKAFWAAVGVGTVDQAILSVLPSNHQSLRLLGLGRGVLIVDEVHAFDPYVHKLLCALLSFQAAMGGSAVLLSATLPKQTRQELVDAFISGYGGMEQDVTDDDFPLVTRVSPELSAEYPVQIRPGTERSMRFEVASEESVVVQSLLQVSKSGACACWVRNSVDDALEAFQRLKELFRTEDGLHEDNVLLFHARFAMGDRLDLERRVLQCFGKHSEDNDRHGKVLIATQVVEQSLDLDFDLLITDLAPIDLLLQRIGREHRHAHRDRPAGYLAPKCIVYAPFPSDDCNSNWFSEFFPRAKLIYPNHGQLWRTAKFICDNPVLYFPEDSRRAIESVYGFEAIPFPSSLQMVTDLAEGDGLAKSDMALGNTLNLRDGYRVTQSQWVEDTVSPTRLGEPTVTFRLGVYDQGAIKPWCDADTRAKAWGLSEFRVMAYRLSDAGEPENEQEKRAREKAIEEMPDKGKFSVLLPIKTAGNGQWLGKGLNENLEELEIVYDPVQGLLFDKIC
ncbi:MAG: CRISPR-associated helicase Cas3' [Desulfohalobiaceae bacterium]|nr:CRISPR-associated helicase Cas3' [Desulfohalobiaceae bacterium]